MVKADILECAVIKMHLFKVAFHSPHLGGGILQVDHTRLNHFMVQVIPLTGTLSHTSKHRVTTMGLGHVVDQLHDQYSLAYTGTTEQTCQVEKTKLVYHASKSRLRKRACLGSYRSFLPWHREPAGPQP